MRTFYYTTIILIMLLSYGFIYFYSVVERIDKGQGDDRRDTRQLTTLIWGLTVGLGGFYMLFNFDAITRNW